MQIDEARELIASKLSSGEVMEYWFEELADTDPGHYGLNDVDAAAEMQNIWVEMNKGTFIYKNVPLAVSARMAGSSDKNGLDESFSVTVSGTGTFKSIGSDNLEITSIHIDGIVDLYGE
jgi:hypothetical protein